MAVILPIPIIVKSGSSELAFGAVTITGAFHANAIQTVVERSDVFSHRDGVTVSVLCQPPGVIVWLWPN